MKNYQSLTVEAKKNNLSGRQKDHPARSRTALSGSPQRVHTFYLGRFEGLLGRPA